MNHEERVRIGIVGMGAMGTGHARDLIAGKIPRAVLTAVADIHPDGPLPSVEVERFAGVQALLASRSVDALIIATPHYDHTPSAIAALGAGLHVLVEKPLAVHKADGQRMIDAYERRPRREQVFAEMFNQRTDPRFRQLRELIRSGELGAVRRISWNATDWFRSDAYYRSSSWRATWRGEGGGVLLNQAPHQLDMLVWLFGAPRRVRAFCQFGAFHDIEVEDQVTAYLEFDNGATGVFTTSTGEAPGENRLVVAGDGGKVVVEPGKMTFIKNERLASEFARTTTERFVGPPSQAIEIPVEGTGPQHAGIMRNFVEAILDGAELIAPATEGLASVELANAMIYSSVREETVEMPLDAQAYERLLGELMGGAHSRERRTIL